MLKRILMALVAMFVLLCTVNAQENTVYQVEMRKAAAENLLRQQVIVLTGKGYLDSWFEIWLYPRQGIFQLQGKNLCFSGQQSARFVVNDLGYLSAYVEGRAASINGCAGLVIRIDAAANKAGAFDYDIATNRESRSGSPLFLQPPSSSR